MIDSMYSHNREVERFIDFEADKVEESIVVVSTSTSDMSDI